LKVTPYEADSLQRSLIYNKYLKEIVGLVGKERQNRHAENKEHSTAGDGDICDQK
jgi:hypothetical protein